MNKLADFVLDNDRRFFELLGTKCGGSITDKIALYWNKGMTILLFLFIWFLVTAPLFVALWFTFVWIVG